MEIREPDMWRLPGTSSYRTVFLSVFVFGVTMGVFEASIVVYLRELYYPDGFSFPLKIAPARLIVVELCREAASIVMLVAVAVIAGKRFWERFGYFLIMFGVWDIVYYVWLKITLGWPATLFDWDILFLIPLPWIGPVIAPALIALLMIVIGTLITRLFADGFLFRPTRLSWLLSLAATGIILFSFMRDIDAGLRQTMPEPYPWWMLAVGLVLYISAFVHVYRRTSKLPVIPTDPSF